MILGEISVTLLKNTASTLWNNPANTEYSRFFCVEVIGAVKSFPITTVSPFKLLFIIKNLLKKKTPNAQSQLILNEPRDHHLLLEVFNAQQKKLQAIVEDIKEIQELSNVSL